MRVDTLKQVLEAAIFAADVPLSRAAMLNLFAANELNADDVTGDQLDRDMLDKLLESLREDYAQRGVELCEVASGFRFQVRSELGHWVGRLWQEKAPRYSRATLETLALIAYRQPITRGEIEEVRGVSVSSQIIKTLLERDWIRLVGHRDVPGRPALYATTRVFLDYFSLRSLEELPTLAAIRDLDDIDRELEGATDGDAPLADTPSDNLAVVQAAASQSPEALNLGVEKQELARIDAILDDFNMNYTEITDAAQPSPQTEVEAVTGSVRDNNTASTFKEKAQ